jgi:hypothetical protein
MSFWGLRSGESCKGSRLASRQPRGVSEGILEGPVPMVRPGPRKNMAGIPEILLSWTKQRSGGSQGNVFTERIVHTLGTWFLSQCELGPSTRIFDQLRERERATTHGAKELTKGGPRKSTSDGRVYMEAHWP